MWLKKLATPQVNQNLTQPNIALVGLDMKMTVHTTTTPTETQCQQYLSCYQGGIIPGNQGTRFPGTYI